MLTHALPGQTKESVPPCRLTTVYHYRIPLPPVVDELRAKMLRKVSIARSSVAMLALLFACGGVVSSCRRGRDEARGV